MSIIRDITLKAQDYLDRDEILLFIGARQAGKTTILRQLQASIEKRGEPSFFMNLDDPDYLSLLNASPKNLFQIFPIDLKKRTVVFLDEIQYLSDPSRFLKYIYDEYRGKIKLIVSGSSAFYIDKKFKDSLSGRKIIFYVWTLSFREFLRFKGEDKLSERDWKTPALSEAEILARNYNEYILYGGYPEVALSPMEEKKEILREIAYSYIKKDIYESRIKKEELFYKLFKILAAQTGNLVNSSELAATIGVSKTAIEHYLYVMRKSFHLHLLPPFFKNIRKELTKMPKVYFFDLGLRNFFTGNFTPYAVRGDDQGRLLENAVFCQLFRSYEIEEIKFWRTIQGNEVDFLVGERQAFEVKAQPKKFQEKKYKVFFENYPSVNLRIASLDVGAAAAAYPIIEVWQI